MIANSKRIVHSFVLGGINKHKFILLLSSVMDFNYENDDSPFTKLIVYQFERQLYSKIKVFVVLVYFKTDTASCHPSII